VLKIESGFLCIVVQCANHYTTGAITKMTNLYISYVLTFDTVWGSVYGPFAWGCIVEGQVFGNRCFEIYLYIETSGNAGSKA